MKRFFTILLCFFSYSICNSQIEKPIYYYDSNGKHISENEFITKKRYHKESISYLTLNFENDSAYIAMLVKRKNYGVLNKELFDSLCTKISITKKVPNEKFTIIQYHPGKDKCNGGNVGATGNRYEKRYLKQLKKDFDFINYWIYKENSQLDYKKSRINWQEDQDQLIEKLFFRFHYPCYSFVIINNHNRKYISVFGEYGKQTVIEIAEEMNKS